jgi:hypothetical protein
MVSNVIEDVDVQLMVSTFVMKPVKGSHLFIVIDINKQILRKDQGSDALERHLLDICLRYETPRDIIKFSMNAEPSISWPILLSSINSPFCRLPE